MPLKKECNDWKNVSSTYWLLHLSHILSFKGIKGIAYLPDPIFNLWYAGSRKLYEIWKQNQNKAPSLYKIRQWLQSKDDYTLLKPVRRKFKTARVIVSELFEQFDIDVMDLSSISTFSDHFRYILVVIDVFSWFLWVEPLKTKTGKEVLKALTAIFDRSGYPKKLRNDSGGEFIFSGLSKF